MNRTLKAAAAGATVALAVAGCNSHHTSGNAAAPASPAASALASGPQVKQAEAKLKSCIASGNLFTSSGRDSIVSCAMPAATSPAARAAVKSCLESDFTSHSFGLTHADRQAILNAGVACLQKK